MSANYSLLCYTREATGREEANNEDIALQHAFGATFRR